MNFTNNCLTNVFLTIFYFNILFYCLISFYLLSFYLSFLFLFIYYLFYKLELITVNRTLPVMLSCQFHDEIDHIQTNFQEDNSLFINVFGNFQKDHIFEYLFSLFKPSKGKSNEQMEQEEDEMFDNGLSEEDEGGFQFLSRKSPAKLQTEKEQRKKERRKLIEKRKQKIMKKIEQMIEEFPQISFGERFPRLIMLYSTRSQLCVEALKAFSKASEVYNGRILFNLVDVETCSGLKLFFFILFFSFILFYSILSFSFSLFLFIYLYFIVYYLHLFSILEEKSIPRIELYISGIKLVEVNNVFSFDEMMQMIKKHIGIFFFATTCF